MWLNEILQNNFITSSACVNYNIFQKDTMIHNYKICRYKFNRNLKHNIININQYHGWLSEL